MKEQSHKSEMRAALRGDFERLRARRDDAVAPMAIAHAVEVSATAPEAVQPGEPVVSELVVAEAAQPRSSWLDRLLDRR